MKTGAQNSPFEREAAMSFAAIHKENANAANEKRIN